jgi:hypothetical protein
MTTTPLTKSILDVVPHELWINVIFPYLDINNVYTSRCIDNDAYNIINRNFKDIILLKYNYPYRQKIFVLSCKCNKYSMAKRLISGINPVNKSNDPLICSHTNYNYKIMGLLLREDTVINYKPNYISSIQPIRMTHYNKIFALASAVKFINNITYPNFCLVNKFMLNTGRKHNNISILNNHVLTRWSIRYLSRYKNEYDPSRNNYEDIKFVANDCLTNNNSIKFLQNLLKKTNNNTNYLLIQAIIDNNIQVVIKILDNNLLQSQILYDVILMMMVYGKKITILELLMKHLEVVTFTAPFDVTFDNNKILKWCITHQHEYMTDIIINHITTEKNRTLTSMVTQTNNFELLDLVLEDKYDEASIVASERGYRDVLHTLITKHDIDLYYKKSSMLNNAVINDHEDIINYLLLILDYSKIHDIAFTSAIRYNNINLAKYLLKTHISCLNDALLITARMGYEKLCEILIRHVNDTNHTNVNHTDVNHTDVNHTDVNHTDIIKDSLKQATINGHLNIIKIIATNHNLEIQHLFEIAIKYKHVHIIEYLLTSDAHDVLDVHDNIILAALYDTIEIIKLLLKHSGTDQTISSEALVFAMKKKNDEMVELLLDKTNFSTKSLSSINDTYNMRDCLITSITYDYMEVFKKALLVNNPGANNSYVFRLAAEHNRIEMVEILLGDGRVNPRALNNAALMCAGRNKHEDLVKLLYNHLTTV